MLAQLPLFHTIARQPVVVLGHGEAAAAKRRLVERAGGIVIDELAEGIDKGARLAFVAHEDARAMEADAIRARCAGLLVNAADRPDLCDFTVPSVLDRAPVIVAIGTGGSSAGLAKQLRLRLETLLPGTLGALAQALHAARAGLRDRWPDAGERRRALDAALSPGGALDPLAPASAAQVPRWLERAGAPGDSDVMEIVLRSADPDDLTLRELRGLGAADAIAHEPAIPAAILDRARADAPRVPLARGTPAPAVAGLLVVLRKEVS